MTKSKQVIEAKANRLKRRQIVLLLSLVAYMIAVSSFNGIGSFYLQTGCSWAAWSRVGDAFSFIVIAFYLPLILSKRLCTSLISDDLFNYEHIKQACDIRVEYLKNLERFCVDDVIMQTLYDKETKSLNLIKHIFNHFNALLPITRAIFLLILCIDIVLICVQHSQYLGPFAIWPVFMFPFVKVFICQQALYLLLKYDVLLEYIIRNDNACVQYLFESHSDFNCTVCPFSTSCGSSERD